MVHPVAGCRHNDTHKAPVKGHAAFPNFENQRGVLPVISGGVEKDISYPSPYHQADDGPKNDIVYVFLGKRRKERDCPLTVQPHQSNAYKIADPVPAHGPPKHVKGDGREGREGHGETPSLLGLLESVLMN
jgi:hypothetical protein